MQTLLLGLKTSPPGRTVVVLKEQCVYLHNSNECTEKPCWDD